MKNLKFLIIAVALLISSSAFAASNLWEFYQGDLPTIAERAEIYDRVDIYKGTAEQNTYLLGKLQGESGITLGGFRPSGYSGKLLTRLNEGGSETTFNTTPGTAPDGSSLTTAKIGDFVVLTINPGGANEEKISASAVSVSGTTATWTIINRGLSFTENAAVTANKNQHAIGETVIISNDDHYFKAQYAAIDEDVTITGDWKVPTPANATSVVNRNYVDGAAFGGIGLSSETATGTVEIATGLEVASSTTNGTLGRLVIPASLATSTYNSATAGLKVVATQNNGKIDPYFIATSSLGVTNDAVLTGTTTMATSTSLFTNGIKLIEIGKNVQVFSSTGTTTFSTPSGVSKIYVQVQAGGGGGGNGTSEGTTDGDAGGGGGGGGFSEEIIDITGTSTIQVFVGSGGTGGTSGTAGTAGGWSTFGTNGYYLYANGGTGGAEATQGTGGASSGGDINYTGQNGGRAINVGTTPYLTYAGKGGDSRLGSGGGGGIVSYPEGVYTSVGEVGLNYGGGGGGGASANSQSNGNGGAGAQGIVIVRW